MIDNAYPLVIKHGNGKTAFFLWRFSSLGTSGKIIELNGGRSSTPRLTTGGSPGFYDYFTAKKNMIFQVFLYFRRIGHDRPHLLIVHPIFRDHYRIIIGSVQCNFMARNGCGSFEECK